MNTIQSREDGISLTMANANAVDKGKNFARMYPSTMTQQGINVGDLVFIKGGRKTVAIAQHLHADETNSNIVRCDAMTRENAGNVRINDNVTISIATIDNNVNDVVVYVLDDNVQLNDDIINLIKRRVKEDLAMKPFVSGDKILYTFAVEREIMLRIVAQTRDVFTITSRSSIVVKQGSSEKLRESWEDVGGLGNEIEKLREIVELPFKYNQLFKQVGVRPPRGILLRGPSGTGKTLLARVVANQIQAHFITFNAPEILSKFYGESEKKLREVFEDAQKQAPSIIFIDEIDAIAPNRREIKGEVEKRIVSQLLGLMDGLKDMEKVVVIGATNMADDIDPALRRSGRFDREIEIGIPDKNGRLEILQIHTRSTPLVEDKDVTSNLFPSNDIVMLEQLAEITHGYVGADLAGLCRDAGINAVKRYISEFENIEDIPLEDLERVRVSQSDFTMALDDTIPSAMREIAVEIPEIHWDDVGGLDEVKQKLQEIVEWGIKKPELYERMGITPPTGVLLYGPPGCGKTLLAKAIATETGCNFISVKGPELLNLYVGESERAVRKLFAKARQVKPCVLFLDEVEELIPERGRTHDNTGVTDRVVSQILAELDGVEVLKNVFVIGATNRPDIIDPAIKRQGRLGEHVYVPPLDEVGRSQVWKIHTKNMPLADDVDLDDLAKITDGYSGADIEGLCRHAGIIALREDEMAEKVKLNHFKEAVSKSNPSITKRMIEFYEKLNKTIASRVKIHDASSIYG